MILILSSNARERAAFGALCDSRSWPFVECDSLHRAARSLRQIQPGVVIVRHRLDDGYSDDAIRLLQQRGLIAGARVIVLLAAGAGAMDEARQVDLGADLVCRDPVRADVIAAYMAKFLREAGQRVQESAEDGGLIRFAGATVDVLKRTLHHAGRATRLTPHEMELLQMLHDAAGRVVTYDMLYAEIMGRRFRGETSNMRVLLGRLRQAFRTVGLGCDDVIEVIPKAGYRYVAQINGTRPEIAHSACAGVPAARTGGP